MDVVLLFICVLLKLLVRMERNCLVVSELIGLVVVCVWFESWLRLMRILVVELL